MWEFAIFVIVFIVVSIIGKAKQQSQRTSGTPSPRVQKLIERIQAQQGGNQPVQFQGQFTQAANQGGPLQPGSFPAQAGTPPTSQQVTAALQQVLAAGRQPQGPGSRNTPLPYSPIVQYNPQAQYQPPAQYNPGPYQPPMHRAQQNNLPSTNQDLDARVRDLMKAGNEVGAVRLLSEERQLGILEAQQYARSLVAPAKAADPDREPDEDDNRYVGSAAFAESIFNLDDREENVWASGWVDNPEPDDRSDIDELWQTVRNAPRPGTTQAT
ncbi:hypothetical protein AB0E69_09920 [Kribbella sp. NPDC026611]|uniref:hypothetical protein n=1 Tax=Kribbella sp. NPDC026611 TaxID=3154911 RepID=UPI0033E3792E